MDEKDVESDLPADALAEAGGGLVDLDGEDESETAIYEVGYHLLPTLSEAELPSIVSKIMELLKGEGANFIGERFPSKISLAYSVPKRIETKRIYFDEAYFGWVAFEILKPAILKIKTALDANPSVLRFLIITTDKNAVATTMSGGALSAQQITPTGDIGKPKRVVEEGGEVSEVALDQALQSIATEDAKVSEEGVGSREESKV